MKVKSIVMSIASNNYVVEWKVSRPKKRVQSRKIVINWMVLFKILIPILLYSWIRFNDFNLNIPIGKNLLAVHAMNSVESSEEWSITWPKGQYWEMDDELAIEFIHQNTSIVQSLEHQNQIPAGIQMAIGLLNIQNFQERANLDNHFSFWSKRKLLGKKWNNQGKAITNLFLEKGQIPNNREEWYQKIVEHFNQQSEGAGYLVQNLIALYDLERLDQQKS